MTDNPVAADASQRVGALVHDACMAARMRVLALIDADES